MTKFYPEHDLSYVYRVEQEAQRMRSEEVGRWLGRAAHAIGKVFKTLDMWFEGARQQNTLDAQILADVFTGRTHLPAVFTDAEKVLMRPANENRGRHVA
jgi:hypothetical protein